MSNTIQLKPFEISAKNLTWNGKQITHLDRTDLLDALVECASLLMVERENLARVNRLLDMQLSLMEKRVDGEEKRASHKVQDEKFCLGEN